MSAYESLQEKVNLLATELNLDIRLGYIGNCSIGLSPSAPAYYDDRSWMIWVEGVKWDTQYNQNTYSFGSFSTEDLDELEWQFEGQDGMYYQLKKLVQNGKVRFTDVTELVRTENAYGTGRYHEEVKISREDVRDRVLAYVGEEG